MGGAWYMYSLEPRAPGYTPCCSGHLLCTFYFTANISFSIDPFIPYRVQVSALICENTFELYNGTVTIGTGMSHFIRLGFNTVRLQIAIYVLAN